MLDLPARSQSGAEAPALAQALARHAKAPGVALTWRGFGLAGQVLAVTLAFILLAMGLFYLTRLSAFREMWLHNKVAAAQTAVEAFNADGPVPPPADLSRRILNSLGLKSIAIVTPAGRRELVLPGFSPEAAEAIAADDSSYLEGIEATFHALFAAPGRIVKVGSSDPPDEAAIEVTFDETPLIDGLWRVSRNFLNISLTIAAVVTCVLWAALWSMVLRPVRRLTSNIIAFGESPQDASRVIAPTGRGNEIGRAEAALAVMQDSLAHELGQRRRLAELGMAVARINHDLRNMLAAAQLISDRLATIPDPLAQRLAPRLVATLDRAILFCQSTLTYGAAREQAPARRSFNLRETVRQVVETAQATSCGAIAYAIEIPPKFELFADPDHVQRAIENLARNAAQALQSQGVRGHGPPAIRFVAIRTDGVALIEISDNGPGFPPEQASRIFEPFHLSTREGGSGLGLAIAADLVARNGGSIALAPSEPDDFYCGARFLITLPAAEDTHKSARAALSA